MLYIKAFNRKLIHSRSRSNRLSSSPCGTSVQLVRAGLCPVYIKVEQKKEYIQALAAADKEQNYDDLYEILFKIILQVHADIHSEG